MGKLSVVTRDGEIQVAWDLREAEAGDARAQAGVTATEQLFHLHRAMGARTFVVRPDGVAPLETFDAAADEIVVVPRSVDVGCVGA